MALGGRQLTRFRCAVSQSTDLIDLLQLETVTIHLQPAQDNVSAVAFEVQRITLLK